MALVPHKITALEQSNDPNVNALNTVTGAVVSLFDLQGQAVLLYDDEAGSNPSTTKTTDSSGQVVVWVTAGEYDESVNGSTLRRISVDGVSVISYATTAGMQSSRPTKAGLRSENRERDNAQYELAESGYVALLGDVVAANGRVWELQTLDNFRAYGNIDDSIDCGPLAQSALNSGRSNTYRFRGKFTVDTPCDIAEIDDLYLDCKGAYFDCSNMFGDDVKNQPDALFKPTGSSALTTTLSSDALENSTSITVSSASGVADGMPVIIRSDEHWYTEGVSIGRTYVGQVSSVSGTTITLQEPLPFKFTVSGFAITVEFIDPIKNFTVEGGVFYGGNYRRDLQNGVGIGFVYAKNYNGVNIKPEFVDGFENTAIRVEKGLNFKASGFDIQGHKPDFGSTTEDVNSGFYGIFTVDSRNVNLSNINGYRCRHTQDASRTYNLNVTNVTGINNHRPALGCHSGTHDGKYTSCNAYGGFGGLQWRGFHLYVIGGEYECPSNASNGIYDVAGGAADLSAIRDIRPSRVLASRNALNIAGKYSHCTVRGDYQNTDSIYSCVEFSSNYLGYADIQAKIYQAGSSGIALKQSSNSASSLGVFKITNSYISSDTNLIRIFAPTNAGSVWISDSVFDASAPVFDVNINNTQIFERIDSNFRPDGTPISVT